MLIDDRVLPAAAHLTGPGAHAVLATTVGAAGGTLAAARPVHVRYRPGADLVVRYEASVRWAGSAAVAETLVAATTTQGVPAGAVPLIAETERGPIEVGVWRWPFDPVVSGLADAVTPSAVARVLGCDPDRLELAVIAYRPTERAVVRATLHGGPTYYLKVLAPERAGELADRHRRLLAAGVPVPPVVDHDRETGILVLGELAGPTLRDAIKSGETRWPDAGEYLTITRALEAADLADAAPTSSRITDATAHARMIATVLPDQRYRLDALIDLFSAGLDRVAARTGPTIHGDLYEAQIVVDGTRVVGILDVDDAGPGDPLDDLATVVAHLRYRAAAHHGRDHVDRYADVLERAFSAHAEARGHTPGELALVTAAALVGLATGPFRIQQRGWRHAVRRHLDRAWAVATAHPTTGAIR